MVTITNHKVEFITQNRCGNFSLSFSDDEIETLLISYYYKILAYGYKHFTGEENIL